MLKKNTHRTVFILATALLCVSLTFSPFLLSIAHFILALNWILEAGFKNKFKIIASGKSILFFISVYIIHVIWLFNTENFHYALTDLKIKLPLLILPIIYGSSSPLTKKELKFIIHIFLATLLIHTLVSTTVLFDQSDIKVTDARNISIFVSHIRFSLILTFGLYILFSLVTGESDLRYASKYFYLIIGIWFLFFILFLGAFTGVLIVLITIPFIVYKVLNMRNNKTALKFFTAFLALLTAVTAFTIGFSIHKYFDRTEIGEQLLPELTVNGNTYSHNNNKHYENRDQVELFVCEKELKSEWEKRSDLSYDGDDLKGQKLKWTLIRYLTSRGFHKDSLGIWSLSQSDIQNIENGFANYLYVKKVSIYPRLHKLFWEIEDYRRNGDPSGHSLVQRLEYLKNGLKVYKRFFWLGTGTGDIQDEILKQYESDKSVLSESWRLKAHNQIATFLISFGTIGFILLLVCFFMVLRLEWKKFDVINLALVLIVFLSFFNEDTFDTQAGVVFFGFFFSLFFYGREVDKQ